MAEAVLSAAVDKFSGYLLQDSCALNGIHVEVEWLERELRDVLCFLRDALSKEKQNDEMVRKWIKDVMDVAHAAEDIIETFMLEADNLAPIGSFERTVTRCSPTTAFENLMLSIGRCFPILSCIVHHHIHGREILETIKARVSEISERRAALGLVNLEEMGDRGSTSIHNSMQGERQLIPEEDDPIIIGFAEHKDIILKKLLSDEKSLSVISLVGMTGSGKTTLVRNIFLTVKVTEEFQACYWISVSQDDRLLEILKKLVEAVEGRERSDRVEYKYIIYDLDRVLSRKKYLIVVDGIWEMQDWDQIHEVLPDKNKGSRVLFTTCNDDFAVSASPAIFPYKLPSLNGEQSRRLLLRKVYPSRNIEEFQEELKIVGQNLVDKCQGLPLALVVLGGYLSIEENNCFRWSRVLTRLDWESSEVGSCLGILDFSYETLPCHLKQCFLYLGSFPKLDEIIAKPLMRLWMVEGFIPPCHGETWEETANGFLEDLAARYLVRVVSRGRDEKVKMFRIHDRIHDFCRIEARRHGFLHFQSLARNQTLLSDTEATRRLASYAIKPTYYLISPKNKKKKAIDSIDHSSKTWRTPTLRTLYFRFSGVGGQLSLNGLTLLRILDVHLDYTWEEVPKEIGSLVNLRYLRWKSGPYMNFQLIKSLLNLQIIDVPCLVSVDSTIGDFKDLWFLRNVSVPENWTEKGLARLTKLRKVVLSDILDTDWNMLLRSLKKLHGLVCLKLNSRSPVPTQVLSMFSRHCTLRHLSVDGALSKLPESRSFPPNLTKLALSLTFLEQDPMSTLMKLPNLVCLKLLDSAYYGKKLHSQAGGFTRLRHLVLRYMLVEAWRVDEGAFPSLTHLTFHTCDHLKRLSKGLKHVSTLQNLTLLAMSPEFMDRIQPEGEDWDKIKHVRHIYSSSHKRSEKMRDCCT
ncbi:putative PHD finger protein [Iris pallida]|uniref:PHD finger protein n=1 Tax=Iris pallida TaxID=29817 RepID=A0AAX6FQ48_IRIPA|nr:putative PHD finger protein [Iris pallida]